ncbi:MAG: thioesterase family protein [Pseudomonadota bacterium]
MDYSFSKLLNSGVVGNDGALSVTVPERWMQGRSTYGGLSAALCLKAAYQASDSLPPLRSAQVSFIGPMGAPLIIKPELLRQGRSVAFVGVDAFELTSGAPKLATRTVFAFGEARKSQFDEHHLPAPTDLPAPEEAPRLFPKGFGPGFAQHFEPKLARGGLPVSGSDINEHFLWIRHEDKEASDMPALLAIADMPPPAMFPKFTAPAPMSSMTWHINILDDQPTTDDGWWLVRTEAENAKDGYSSQDMTLWNLGGVPVLSMCQSVTIFT